MSKLEESQKRLDAIEEKLIANKKARIQLRDEAIELRNEYIAEEKIRETELRLELTKETN
jgi:hypothetical protein